MLGLLSQKNSYTIYKITSILIWETIIKIDYEFEAKFSRDLCDQENNNGVCSLSGMGKNYPGDYSQWLDDIYYYNVYPYEPADFDKMYYFFLEDFVALGNTLGTYPGSPQYSEPLLGKTVLSYYGYWF